MKRCILAFRVFSSALVTLIALAFTVIEASLLVTLDFNLYENVPLALLRLLLRLLIAMAAGAVGILSLIKKDRPFLAEGICLLVASAVMLPFISNGFGLYITLASALFLLSRLLYSKKA